MALGDVLPFRYGKGLPQRVRSRSGEYAVVSSAGATDTHNQALTTGPSVVVGRKGSIGTVYYCPEPVWPIDTAFYVEGSDEVDIRFAYFLLQSLPLKEMNNDSAVPGLNRAHAESLIIELPPTDVQASIAGVLGAFDDKIESNRRAMQHLEDLGASILDQRLQFESSGLPVTDQDNRLGDYLSVCETGARPKGGASTDGSGVVSLGAESVQSAGVMNIGTQKTVPHAFAQSLKRGHLADRDVLVYKDGGKPGNFIPHVSAFGLGFPVAEATINEHVYRVRGRDDVSQGLLYWVLRSHWMDDEMRRRGTGAAIPGLNSTNFKSLPWPAIERGDLLDLNPVLDSMLDALLRYGAENLRLAALRDALLPGLVSGGLQVSEIEG